MSDNLSVDTLLDLCSNSTASYVGSIATNATKASLLIPLYIFVLYLGLQQWRQQRSFRTASHSDIFTYHLAAFELIWLVATGFYSFSVPTPFGMKVAYHILIITWYGENFFQVLTCVERYLAVVHPIVYMRLRNARGVRIRNISIGCVWILSSVCSGFVALNSNTIIPIMSLTLIALCLAAVSFCSLSVLYVLIRPGPGEGGQYREQVDQAKKRAFFIITVILLVLWLWLGGLIASYAVVMKNRVSNEVKCMGFFVAYMFNLPCATVLPLLYLQRAGKRPCCFH